MSAALRQAWARWCSFADPLDLSDGSADVAALHARLFRLTGSTAPSGPALADVRERVRAAFAPWLGDEGDPPGELEALRRAMAACDTAWNALLGLGERSKPDRQAIERVARAAGLPWPDGPFWTSPLHVEGRSFDVLNALRGRDHDASLALLDALLRVQAHPDGVPLYRWYRSTPSLRRPADALHAAGLFRDAVAQGAVKPEWVGPLGLADLPGRLRRLCEDVCLCLLNRLNEPLPGFERPAPWRGPGAPPVCPAPYRRAAPDPLPVEPYFQKIPGSAAFLQAIAEEPLEDSHRLAFADWLEEAGHAPRAALLRLQCARDRLPEYPLARCALDGPIAALLKAHAAEWAAGLPRCPGVKWDHPENFRRGMLERLTIDHPLDPAVYGTAFGAVDVRGLRPTLYGSCHPPEQTGIRALLATPYAARLVSLCLGDGMPEAADMEQLADPALAGLVELDLSRSGGRVAEGLASLRLPRLARLDLSESTLGDEGTCALAASPIASTLRILNLRDARIYLPGVRALASSASLAGLEQLDVSGNRIGRAGIAALASSPFLANLTALGAGGSFAYRAEGRRPAPVALASSPYLKRLTCLGLADARLSPDDLAALAGAAGLAGLTVLDLSDNGQLGSAELRALAESPHLARLRALSLRGVTLGVDHARALAESRGWANLDALDLASTGLDGPAVKALLDSPHLNNLAFLDLRPCKISRGLARSVRERWPFVLL